MHIDSGIPGDKLLLYEILFWKTLQSQFENQRSFVDIPRCNVHGLGFVGKDIH
jgi:hypothetical protein